MIQRGNMCGGITLTLRKGDTLDEVPDSHRDIITLEIRDAFCDPCAYFNSMAQRSRIDSFSKWIRALTLSGQWSLVLADTYMMDRETWGGFRWVAPHVQGALIAPGTDGPLQPPQLDFDDLYSLVRFVHWDDVGNAGGILRADAHVSLRDLGIATSTRDFPEDESFVFAFTSCGDMLVCNMDGKAGFLSHETCAAYALGSVTHALNWVFEQLLAGHEPQFNYAQVNRDREKLDEDDDDPDPPTIRLWPGND